jgi:hypothetical protein
MRASVKASRCAIAALGALAVVGIAPGAAWADGFEKGLPCSYAGPGAIPATTGSVTTVPGHPYTPPVHEFTDAEKEPSSNFTVTANWGDGTSSPASVSGEGCYQVSAPAHTYTKPGSYSFSETVHDAHTGLEHTVGSEQFNVASTLPTPAIASPLPSIRITAGIPWTGTLGEFKINVGVGEPLSAYTASIEWGDGQSSPGTIASPGFLAFTVGGSHTYSRPLSATIRVSVSAGIETGTWSAANVLVVPLTLAGGSGAFKLVHQAILAAIPTAHGRKAYELVFRLGRQLPRTGRGRIAASLEAFGHTSSIAGFGPHKSHACYAAKVAPSARQAPTPGKSYPFTLRVQSPASMTAAKAVARRYPSLAGTLASASRRLGC